MKTKIAKFGVNKRGWLKSSISDQFSIQLNYQDVINVPPQYNGNISNQLWGPGNNPAINTFSYSYDRLNRLTNASSPNLSEAISYDVMVTSPAWREITLEQIIIQVTRVTN